SPIDRAASRPAEYHILTLLAQHVPIDKGGFCDDLRRRPESCLAVAAELKERRLARFGPSHPCSPEGEARDIRPVQPVALLAPEVKGPFGKAGIAHGMEQKIEVLAVAEMQVEYAPELYAENGDGAAGLRRCVAGFLQTTGSHISCGEQEMGFGETRRFGTSAL